MKNGLIDNGMSDYKIIIPINADFYEKYAADEFKRLFIEASGIELEIITDGENLTGEETGIISVGRTVYCKRAGVNHEYQELKRDGYRIETHGRALFLVGGGTYGTVYAVYGFMERVFGYRYYAPDEYKIEKMENCVLPELSITDIPDIENRTGGFYYSKVDEDCAIRMRTFTYYGMLRDGEDFFGSWAHNHIKEYLPLDKYREEHMDWYSPEFTQLCLSNEEMWVEMAERVKARIAERPEAEYFLLGQEDRPTFCGCPRCLKLAEEIGRSGIMMRFVNYIAREVKKWQKDNCPERNIYIGTFAYQKTQDPPVYLGENGYLPIDDTVVPEDNVFIMLAPISADCSVPINNAEHNSLAKKTLDGWYSLTKHCVLWTYCSNFNRSLGFFDNFHVLAENYKIFKKYNFNWVYYENNSRKQGMAFQPMLCFVHSQLAWKTDLDLRELINEFALAYYKVAAPQILQYLEAMDDYYKTKKREFSLRDGRYYGTYLWNSQEETSVLTKEFYSYTFLKDMFALLTDGIKAVEREGYDNETERKLVNRIVLERLTIRFLVAEFFEHEFDKQAYYAYLDEFEKECSALNIDFIKTRRKNEETFNDWRNKF